MLEITSDNTEQSSSLEISKQISDLKKINKGTGRDISGSHFFKLNQLILVSDLNCEEINQAMSEYFAGVKTLNETDKKLLKMMLFNYWVPPQDFPDFEFEYSKNQFYGKSIIKVANYKKLKNPENLLGFKMSVEEILSYKEIYKAQQNISSPEDSYKISLNSDEFYFLSSFGLVKFFDANKFSQSSMVNDSSFKNQKFRNFLDEINRDFVLMQNQNNKDLLESSMNGTLTIKYLLTDQELKSSFEITRISLSNYTPRSSQDISTKTHETIFLTPSGVFLENQQPQNLCDNLKILYTSCLAFFGCISALEIDNIKRDDCSLHPKGFVATTAFQATTNSQVNSTRKDLEMY